MSISPIITFKAGMCDFDTSSTPPKVKALPTPGYLYLYEEDELMKFCWRHRNASMSQPDLELLIPPTDGRFVPYTGPSNSESNNSAATKSPTSGRVFVLKFQSSTQRHLFWLQSKSQHPQGDASWFSPRDLKLGDIVNRLLQGDQVDAREELNNVPNGGGGDDEGGDAEMEDAPTGDSSGPQGENNENSSSRHQDGGDSGQSGNAGGGGGAAPTDDATAAVQNFLRSMQGNAHLTNLPNQSQNPQGRVFTTLPDLLPPSVTIPFIDSADTKIVDRLLGDLPPVLLLLSQEGADETTTPEPTAETAKAAMAAMSLDQKKEILRRVLRSPQFVQSLASLTTALRDGGLPTIGDALGIPVENGGLIRGGSMPLGGGDAVEAFVKGVKSSVERAAEKTEEKEEGRMETD